MIQNALALNTSRKILHMIRIYTKARDVCLGAGRHNGARFFNERIACLLDDLKAQYAYLN